MFVEEKPANNRKDLLTSGIRFLKDLVATGIVLNGNKLNHIEHRTKYDDDERRKEGHCSKTEVSLLHSLP